MEIEFTGRHLTEIKGQKKNQVNDIFTSITSQVKARLIFRSHEGAEGSQETQSQESRDGGSQWGCKRALTSPPQRFLWVGKAAPSVLTEDPQMDSMTQDGDCTPGLFPVA